MLLLYSLRVSFLYLSPDRNLILTGQQCVFIHETKRARRDITLIFIYRFSIIRSLTQVSIWHDIDFTVLRNGLF